MDPAWKILVKRPRSLENPGSISLCFEKMSKQLKAFLKKSMQDCEHFLRKDRFPSPNLYLFKKVIFD